MIETDSTMQDLQQEWLCLQTQYDSYEKYSLLIKLTNIVLSSMLIVFFQGHVALLLSVTTILWLQDSIWKTFQSRIDQRLLQLEAAIADSEPCTAMQFNRNWLATRPGAVGLIVEYLKQACKPTVAFPHAVLLMLIAWITF